jgi:hypothetical protein
MPQTTLQGVAEKQQTAVTTAVSERIKDAVTDAVITGEDLPALVLADQILRENRDLFRQYVAHLVDVRRRAMARQKQLPLFPEFERRFSHIPKRIHLPNGKIFRKGKATWRQFERLSYSLEARFKAVPIRKEVKAIMALMRPYAKETPGITYDEVKRRESERLGWPE